MAVCYLMCPDQLLEEKVRLQEGQVAASGLLGPSESICSDPTGQRVGGWRGAVQGHAGTLAFRDF